MAAQNLNFNIRIGYDDAAVGQGAQRTEAQLRGLVSEVERVAREMAAARQPTQQTRSMIELLGTNASRAADQLSRMGADGSRALRELESAAQRTQSATARTATSINQLGDAFRTAAIGVAAFQAAQAAMNLGQTAAQMQDVFIRLHGVTEATGNYAAAEQFLIQLSEQHHKTISGLADGYTQILSLEESGILTRQEANKVMEGLSNAQSKYGTSNEQIKQSLYGLSQAMSASTVQMDELHQVTDPMPGLLSKLEKAAGVAAGGFKAMAERSELTRDMVKDSLIKVLGDMDGAAAKTAGTMTSAANDIKREWELLARSAEAPITFVVRVAADGVTSALKNIRETIENGLPEPLGSVSRFWARGGYLPGASNVDPLEAQFTDKKLGQAYERDLTQRMDAAFPTLKAKPTTDTSGFTGPAIPDDVLKQRTKDAATLEEQYKKLLEQSGNYREALALEAKAKNLSEAATQTYIDQGMRLIEQKNTEHASHKTNTAATHAYAAALQQATQEIESNRAAMESQIDTVQRTLRAEKDIELIRAGDNRTAQLEIETRYIENERVVLQQRLQDEIAFDQQLIETNARRENAAQLTRQLSEHQAALNAVNDDASTALERLNAAERARGDARLNSLQQSALDKQQLAVLAQKLAAEGATADQIQRQIDLKQQLLTADRAMPNRPDIQAAIQQEATASEQYHTVLDETRKSAEQYAELWKTAARRVDDTFQQLWDDLISGQNSVGGSLKKMLTSTLAEIAHASITKPMEQKLLSYLGAPAGTGDSLGGGGIMGSLLDKVGGWLTGTGNTATAATTPALPGITATSSGSGLLNVLSGGATAAGMAANALSGTSALATTTASGLPAFTLAQQLGPLPYSPVAAMSPIANATVPAAAASAGSSFWSIGQSPFLGKIGTSLAGKLGFGAATSGAIGTGFANSPWGAVGSIAAQLLGIQGTNPIANMALPTIGGIAGGALGGSLMGASLGMAAGPIGAIIGALAGSALSMLFNSTPKAEARYRYTGGSGSMQLTDAWKRNGGQLGMMKELGSSMYTPLRQLERGFQVDLGQFDTAFYQRDKNVTMWGKETDGSLFFEEKLKFTESAIKDGMSRFMVSIVKRESVLRQFDGALVQGAVKLSKTMDDLQTHYGRATRIRAYTGDTTTVTTATAELFRKNQKYTDNIRELLPDDAAARVSELLKVSAATARGFSAIVTQFNQSLDELNGTGSSVIKTLQDIDDQHRALTTQNNELARSAEKLGQTYTKLDQSQIDAARTAAQQAVRTGFVQALRDAAGVADATAQAITDLADRFQQFARDAAALNIEIESVGAAMLGAFSNVAQQIRRPTQDAINALKLSIAELDGTMNQVLLGVKNAAVAALDATKDKDTYKFNSADQGLSLISAAQTAILANYQQQKATADALIQAAKSIQEYSKGLVFTPLSTASPKTQLDTAKTNYTDLKNRINKTTDDAAKTTLLNQVTGVAGQYLQSALAYMGPTAGYNKLFTSIQADLDKLGQSVPASRNYQQETINALTQLQAPLNAVVSMNNTSIAQAADQLAALNLLRQDQKEILTAITTGATYNAITDITANVKANAKITGLQTAIDTALQSDSKLTQDEASSIMSYISNLGMTSNADISALGSMIASLRAQAEAYSALSKTGPQNRANTLADAISAKIPTAPSAAPASTASSTAPASTAPSAAPASTAPSGSIKLPDAIKNASAQNAEAVYTFAVQNLLSTGTGTLSRTPDITQDTLQQLKTLLANINIADLTDIQQTRLDSVLALARTKSTDNTNITEFASILDTAINGDPTKNTKKAANDPWFYKKTDVESVINAPFNSDTVTLKTLRAINTNTHTDINNVLSELGTTNRTLNSSHTATMRALGTIDTTLTNINTTTLSAISMTNAMLTYINIALTDQNAKTETLIHSIGTNGNMSVITYLDELRNALLDINNAALDNKDELTAIKTGITALPASFTALAASNQTAATTLAGGLTGFGKSLTDGLSSLGSALYNGLNSVGSAVGAKITDLNTALKTTQSQLATANDALSAAQTALTQAQASKPGTITLTVSTDILNKSNIVQKNELFAALQAAKPVSARATGGPALGWTLVGEEGPELVRFPMPVQVHSNSQTKSILQNSQDQGELIGKMQTLIELQAQTIATLQQQGRNQSEQLDGLHREFARFGGKVRLAA